MKIILRFLGVSMVMGLCCLVAFLFYVRTTLPDEITVVQGEQVDITPGYGIELTWGEYGLPVAAGMAEVGSSYDMQFEFPGGLVLKTVQIDVVERKMVVPSGEPFGIKMFTRGVIVVGMSDIPSDGVRQTPARLAGLELGDIILEIDGQEINGNKMVGDLVSDSGGAVLPVTVQRGEELLQLDLTPALSDSDGVWRAGIWVRDSSAGIGTMTYYDPADGTFAGLGHAVCDVDTSEIMPLESGEIVGVDITGVSKGQVGAPGELQGSFVIGQDTGKLTDNTHTGLYGDMDSSILWKLDTNPVPLATKSEVVPGPATILSTIDGSAPMEYTVYIEKVDTTGESEVKNMVIRVTDPLLLSTTGGIVQGMSGSPIMQDGKLVGAVTHVFVNDPTRGFGIFIENMQDSAQSIGE